MISCNYRNSIGCRPRRASALPFTLIVIALLGILSAETALYAITAARAVAARREQLRSRNSGLERLYVDASALLASSDTLRQFRRLEPDGGGELLLATFATDAVLSETELYGEQLPAIDFTSLMQNALPCPHSQRQAGGSESPLGMPLTPDSARSGELCEALNLSGELPYFVPANLLVHRVSASSAQITAAGFLEAKEIEISDAIRLIAGGDLHIERLNFKSGAFPGTALLFSASGVVRIDAVSGSGNVAILARRSSFLPPGVPQAAIASTLPLLRALPVALNR